MGGWVTRRVVAAASRESKKVRVVRCEVRGVETTRSFSGPHLIPHNSYLTPNPIDRNDP
jgi:hypothetical protein